VYIWTDPISRLAPELWTFTQFLRDKVHRWVGAAGEKEYADVDRLREATGSIILSTREEVEVHAVAEEGGLAASIATGEARLERFGRQFGKKWWTFEEGWTNLNHGGINSPLFALIAGVPSLTMPFKPVQARTVPRPSLS